MTRPRNPTDGEFQKVESLTQTEAAKMLRVPRSTLAGWDAPRNGDGTYNLPRVIRWAFAFGPWRSEQARDDMLRCNLEGER